MMHSETHLIHAVLSTLWYFQLRQIIVVIYSMHRGGGAKCKFDDKHNKCSVENGDAAAAAAAAAAATAIHSIKIPHYYDAAGNIIINNICIRMLVCTMSGFAGGDWDCIRLEIGETHTQNCSMDFAGQEILGIFWIFSTFFSDKKPHT